MTTSTLHHRWCTHIPPGSHALDTAPASKLADVSACGDPLDPVRGVIRKSTTALLLVVALVALVALAHEAHAEPTQILLSNGGPPPSTRLLLVNVAQRHVAQEFTTGPHPGGYDIYAVAVRTEVSSGKHSMGLQGRIRNRRWESAGPWNLMLPNRQVGPTLTRSRPVSDFNWSWFMSSEPIHLDPNETYFFELVCSWGCFAADNKVGLGLTESNDEDDSSLPGWSMADGFMIQNARFNRWWGDMVVGTDGFFHPNPQGPTLRLEIRGEPREFAGLPAGETGMPEVSAADEQVLEAPNARLVFSVTLSSTTTSPVTVLFRTEDGTATAGTDYVPMSGRLVFAPGQTERTVDVPVLHDSRKEEAETLTLRLLSATGAQLTDAQATGTIVNAGPRPREWLAGHGPTVAPPLADADGKSLDGTSSHMLIAGMEPPSPVAVEARDALAAHREQPAWEDSGRGLVGTWSTRFGAMPVPPATSTKGVGTGASRAPASHGGQPLPERTLDGGSVIPVSASGGGVPVLVNWGRGAKDGIEWDTYDPEMYREVATDPSGAGIERGRRQVGITELHDEGNVDNHAPLENREGRSVESTPTSMSPSLRLALSEPISAWGSRRCDDR